MDRNVRGKEMIRPNDRDPQLACRGKRRPAKEEMVLQMNHIRAQCLDRAAHRAASEDAGRYPEPRVDEERNRANLMYGHALSVRVRRASKRSRGRHDEDFVAAPLQSSCQALRGVRRPIDARRIRVRNKDYPHDFASRA